MNALVGGGRFLVICAAALGLVGAAKGAAPKRGAVIVAEGFSGVKGTAIAGRTPDTADAPEGKWSVVAINLGGSFDAVIDADGGHPPGMAYLVCAGNSAGAIAVPTASHGAYTKPARLTIAADVRGAHPALGFYSALPVQDQAGAFDVFSNFTGLELGGDGTLSLYVKGGFVASVKYGGTFDGTEFHRLSYTVDTRSGLIVDVQLQGSDSDYRALNGPGAFTDQATAFAGVAALCEQGRDNQTYADNFLLAAGADDGTPPPLVKEQVATDSPILVHSGEKIAFMGDSITALGNSPRGYVQLVIAGLKAEGVQSIGIPAGHSGDTSGNMIQRTNIDVLHKGANWMTISCGVNDVAAPEREPGVNFESFKRNVQGMVAKAEGWNVRVLLLTATPRGEDLSNDYNKKLAAYNAFLRDFAQEKKLPLADVNAAFIAVLKSAAPAGTIPGRRLLADGLHPNDAGQFIMATTVLEALGVPQADMPRVEQALREGMKGK